MKPLRLAVVGVGHLGRSHARIAAGLEAVELVAVIDPDPAQRRAASQAHGVPGYASLDELDVRIDAAVVSTPTFTHHDVALALVARGAHLFVEKPLARSAEEGALIVDAAWRAGLVLQVGHVERFNPAWSAVLPHLRDVKYLESHRTSSYKFRSIDIGVVLDLMIHDLDLALSLVRSPVARVEALGIALFGQREDVAQARLTFANGCVATFNASRASYHAVRRMQLWSQRCFAAVDFGARTGELVCPAEEIAGRRFDVERLTAAQREMLKDEFLERYLPRQQLACQPCDQLTAELEDFVDSIRGNRTPRVTGQQALETLAVAEQVLAAIERHGWDGSRGGRQGARALPGEPPLQGPHWLSKTQLPLPESHREAG